MEYIVKPQKIKIGAKKLEALLQEINTLLCTRKGNVPLDREFGIDWDFVDKPINEAKPLYVAEISRQIEKYIPKIKVLEVQFLEQEQSYFGKITPKIIFEIKEEYTHEFQ